MSIKSQLERVRATLPEGVTLVAVSKTHPIEAIAEAYEAGQRVFGESRPQELRAKYEALLHDIEWHMIGHLQTNKIKYIDYYSALVDEHGGLPKKYAADGVHPNLEAYQIMEAILLENL